MAVSRCGWALAHAENYFVFTLGLLAVIIVYVAFSKVGDRGEYRHGQTMVTIAYDPPAAAPAAPRSRRTL